MDKNAEVHFDKEKNILYLLLKPGKASGSKEIKNIKLEYDEKGEVIGIEIRNFSEFVATAIAKHLGEVLRSEETAEED